MSHTPPLSSNLSLASNPLLLDQFLAPARFVLENYVRGVLLTGAITDDDFIRLGCLRTLSPVRSGRDFIQQQNECFKEGLLRPTFFKSLHSQRRQSILAELNRELFARTTARFAVQGRDLLAAFPELRQREIYAVDGHHIEHATHSRADPKGRFVSTNNLFQLCLHSGLLSNFSLVQGDGQYRHEMAAFRGQLPPWLGARGGRQRGPPIWVVDPAFIDKQFWTRMLLLRQRGALVLTRTKSNMKLTVYSRRPWDPAAPVNQGIREDAMVGSDGSAMMRRIQFEDPETGIHYEFLTTVLDLAPGLLALLYLMRWRIEKVFDTAKNKLGEVKSWATGEVARSIHAHFLALTHNLLVLFRNELEANHRITEEKLDLKRRQELKRREDRAAEAGRSLHPSIWRLPTVVQISLQFLRVLRNGILQKLSLAATLPRFSAMLKGYL